MGKTTRTRPQHLLKEKRTVFEKCHHNGKDCYHSKARARAVMRRVRSSQARFKLQRVYRGPHCGYWHTTSMRRYDP